LARARIAGAGTHGLASGGDARRDRELEAELAPWRVVDQASRVPGLHLDAARQEVEAVHLDSVAGPSLRWFNRDLRPGIHQLEITTRLCLAAARQGSHIP
jgi:hypothetical protein